MWEASDVEELVGFRFWAPSLPAKPSHPKDLEPLKPEP